MAHKLVDIQVIGGNCPVQAEGVIDNQEFYFRARGEHWSIGIGGSDVVGRPDWFMQARWGKEKFDAGWMPEEEATRLINEAAEAYVKTVYGAETED